MSVTWPHIIEDNFLTEKQFKHVTQYSNLKLKSDTGVAVIKNKIWLDGKTEGKYRVRIFIIFGRHP